jgi:hypothetical protein
MRGGSHRGVLVSLNESLELSIFGDGMLKTVLLMIVIDFITVIDCEIVWDTFRFNLCCDQCVYFQNFI